MPQLKRYSMVNSACLQDVELAGFADFGKAGVWTSGRAARLVIRYPAEPETDVLVMLNLLPFLYSDALKAQPVAVAVNGAPAADWTLQDHCWRWRGLLVDRATVARSGKLQIDFIIPNCAAPSALGLSGDQRLLGFMVRTLSWEPMERREYERRNLAQLGRPVGEESRKVFDERLISGFWSEYIRGPKVLDIGFKGYIDEGRIQPIVDGAIGVDLDYPGYDGRTLPFPENSQDVVYSSHCLEHIADYVNAIQDWYRVTRPGGHIIAAVPSGCLYERRLRPPSRWNGAHMRFYTPASLLAEFEAALPVNGYRVRHLAENDQDYDYSIPPERHAGGCYEIELVVQKIERPAWRIVD